MWPRFTLDDLRNIAYYLGVLVALSASIYIPSIVVGVCFREWSAAARYVFAAGLNLCVGEALQFLRINQKRLTKKQAIAITGMAWIVLALLASVPLFFSGHYLSWTDALFDGVSGFTTTGACLVQDVEHLSYADNMFRFSMLFVGGLGLVVVALSLGLFGKSGGASLYSCEGRSEHIVPNVMHSTRLILSVCLVYIALSTLILTIICTVLGMSPVRSFLHGLWLAVSGFMTGGFAPTSQSVLYYHCFALEAVLMLVMFMGSLNFVMHTNIWSGRLLAFFRDIETRTMIVWLFITTLVFAASMCSQTNTSSLFTMLRTGVFSLVSAFSTTGLQNISTSQLTTTLSSGALLLLAMVMAVGASSGGTAGGMKLLRLGIVMKSVVISLKEALLPASSRVVVSYYHAGKHQLTHSTSREALTVFLLFVGTYVLGTLAGIAYGYESTQAIFESVAMASNAGLTSGIVSAGMPLGLELFYMLEMWAGRLEFITFIALLVCLVTSVRPRGILKMGLGR